MDRSLITRIVEAALLASPQPLSLAQLHGLFPEDEPAPAGSVEAALEQLGADCEHRGVELVEVASGFRYQVRQDVHGWVSRLWTERRTKYTRATLETLALIAYRQPITRGEIEQVRGVAVSSNIIQALEEREWIRVVGHRDVPGRPALFGTTRAFLDYFGLKRLDDLPPLSDLKDFAELEPQLPLEGNALPASAAAVDAAADFTPSSGAEPEAAAAPDAGDADSDQDERHVAPSAASGDRPGGHGHPIEHEDAADTAGALPSHLAGDAHDDAGPDPTQEDDAQAVSSEQKS